MTFISVSIRLEVLLTLDRAVTRPVRLEVSVVSGQVCWVSGRLFILLLFSSAWPWGWGSTVMPTKRLC